MVKYGTIVEPKCYQKVCEPEHYMIKFQGFGISESILQELQEEGVKIIRIIYMGKIETRVYITSVIEFTKSLKTHNFNGNDLQYFVSIKDMIEI